MQPPHHFESKTEKGLKFLLFGLLLIIIYQILFTGFIYANTESITEMQTEANEESSLSGESLRNLGILCGGQLIMVFGLILILLGIVNYYNYRAEFGEEHSENVKKSLILLILGFVISLIGGLTGISQDADIVIPITIVTLIVTAICYAIGFIYLLKSILDDKGLDFLKLGSILLIIFNIINSLLLVIAWKIPDSIGSDSNITLIGFSIIEISNIPWAIFIFSIFRAWKRIQWGYLKPATIDYIAQPMAPIGPTPSTPEPSSLSQGKKCPSCGYVQNMPTSECPKCGYYFSDE